MTGRLIIDCLQYVNWSPKVFRELQQGGVSAIHVTIAYHETLREVLHNIGQWKRWFEQHQELIMPGRTASDVKTARSTGKTAVFFGFQHCLPIEDDIDMIAIWHDLGIRFMQLTYNNQSPLATGCYEDHDAGITRFGKQAIAEMNRVGLVVDMSHSGERSTLEAIDISSRPIAITHANPKSWHPALRNKGDHVLKALTSRGGMLGLSLYPHHLKDGSNCTLESFCKMAAETASCYGIENVGIGSDLCQDQPDSVVTWMRNGRWAREMDYGEGSAQNAGFPPQPKWFENNLHFGNIAEGLASVGMNEDEINGIMGGNWLRFFASSFGPA